MSSTNLATAAEILQKFYAAETIYMSSPTAQNKESMLATLSPTIILSQSPDLPWGGEMHGHAGFQQWSETMNSYFDELDVQNPKIFEQSGGGGDQVVVHSTLKLKVKKSERVLRRPLVQVVKVDRTEGVITEMKPFYWDVKGLREELGL